MDVCGDEEICEILRNAAAEQIAVKGKERMSKRTQEELDWEMEHSFDKLASRVAVAEDMLSESMRENEVLRDTVVQMAEGLTPELLEEITNRAREEEKKKSKKKSPDAQTQELRRLVILCSGSISCLEETGNHVRIDYLHFIFYLFFWMQR